MAQRKMDNLPLEWVRVFEAAGRTGNFTLAAEECGLTQAAVSQRIRNLEERIGAILFTRQARGVTLTVDGEAWLPYVTNSLQALNRSAEELFGKPLRKLVISASASVTQLWITPRLAALAGKADYQISLTTMNVEADFAKAKATVDIRYGSGSWPDMHSAPLFKEVMAPLASPDIWKKGMDWRDLPRIAVSGPRPGWQEWAAQTGDTAPPIPKFRFDSFVAAHGAAKAGLGVILAPLPLCGPDLADRTLIRLSANDLNHDAGNWMVAPERLPKKQWESLVKALCQPVF